MAPTLTPSQGRPSRSIPQSNNHYNADTPRKRRKYIPGGPGGGGRWIEEASHTHTTSITPRPPLERVRSRQSPATVTRPRRERAPDKPTFDSAADAAAAAVQVDGYKPREERGWEEFHPDLDIEVRLVAYSSNQVDGISEDHNNVEKLGLLSLVKWGYSTEGDGVTAPVKQPLGPATPPKRKPGRPPRRPESMLSGLGSPPAQKIIPIPAQNPRERLTLPKPSYREVFTFESFEADKRLQENYVDKIMRRVGYQESETFLRPKNLIRHDEALLDSADADTGVRIESEKDALDSIGGASFNQVEYDMDEQDEQWLEAFNVLRKEQEQVDAIKPAVFEVTMTMIEKEWHALERRIPKPNPKPPQTQRPRSSSSAAVNGEPAGAGEEQDTKCVICDDGDCENTNAIVFCDGCDLAVHQECYGVPFIPEGQWLCRKCQQVGRGTPTCIFCPNTDGAFKLTSESRWAHLLCAIWIPEVTLGNQIFMEPVMEVAAVPKQRWRLVCYICNQKMGACIQCGNKNCYQAFHVTCARRAQLFLKMKSAHGGPASLDASILKAFCDRHVPSEWRREHDVDTATAMAKQYYRHEMRGRKWADSQQSALALVPTTAPKPPEFAVIASPEESNAANSGAMAQKKRRQQVQQKNIWRLPSGAPVVPQIVANAVEEMVARFNVRKRKEYVAEACKYWTLKREARRGAALLKRLQLQMETFSTSEITRRDFAAMGAAGRPRLERRIEFAERLEAEMSALRSICEAVKHREEIKLKNAKLLRGVVDIMYSPITSLLWPIIQKAARLAQPPLPSEKSEEQMDNGRKMFSQAFGSLEIKLRQRLYNSVQAFSADLGSVFRFVPGLESVNDAIEAHNLMSLSASRDEPLNSEQKEIKKLAKRIAKAIQAPLEDALQKEAELIHAKPFEKELRNLETTWDNTASPDEPQLLIPAALVAKEKDSALILIKDQGEEAALDSKQTWKGPTTSNIRYGDSITAYWQASPISKSSFDADSHPVTSFPNRNSDPKLNPSILVDTLAGTIEQAEKVENASQHDEPLTPPRSEKDLPTLLTQGGIPWYLECFSPSGITVQDESYDGLKVRREMSEELSEMDDDELMELGVDSKVPAGEPELEPEGHPLIGNTKAPAKKRKRFRGYY